MLNKLYVGPTTADYKTAKTADELKTLQAVWDEEYKSDRHHDPWEIIEYKAPYYFRAGAVKIVGEKAPKKKIVKKPVDGSKEATDAEDGEAEDKIIGSKGVEIGRGDHHKSQVVLH